LIGPPPNKAERAEHHARKNAAQKRKADAAAAKAAADAAKRAEERAATAGKNPQGEDIATAIKHLQLKTRTPEAKVEEVFGYSGGARGGRSSGYGGGGFGGGAYSDGGGRGEGRDERDVVPSAVPKFERTPAIFPVTVYEVAAFGVKVQAPYHDGTTTTLYNAMARCSGSTEEELNFTLEDAIGPPARSFEALACMCPIAFLAESAFFYTCCRWKLCRNAEVGSSQRA
jgi:hypothetical protein